MKLAGIYSSWTDAALDQAYADAYKGVTSTSGAAQVAYSQAMTDIGNEIVTRLSTVIQFEKAAFWPFNLMSPTFPQYDAISKQSGTGFVASTQATASLDQTAIGQTVNTAILSTESAAKSLASGAGKALSAGKWIGIGVLAVALLVLTSQARRIL